MIFSSPDPAADPYVVAAVLALQRASYLLEAKLIGDDRLPPLQEDERELAAWRGTWVLAWDGVELVGAIAWSGRGGLVDIEKLMVSPTATRQGVGTALLERVLVASAGRQLMVATARDNVPAVSLYARHGFVRVADEQVPPGILIARLVRRGSG